MDDEIQQFMEVSKKINSRSLSFTRFVILTLLSYFKDGLQFRELRIALGISDGKLFSNLNRLQKMGYIKKFTIMYDHKKLYVFSLTETGKAELLLMTGWTGIAERIVKKDYSKCQPIVIK